VPAGFRAVVKCISLVTGVNISTAWAGIIGPGAAYLARDYQSSGPTSGQTFVHYGQWVVEAGESLAAINDGASSFDIWCSGYLLTLP